MNLDRFSDPMPGEQPDRTDDAIQKAEHRLDREREEDDGMKVVLVRHARGDRLRIEHNGFAMSFNRDEAIELESKLANAIWSMPVKI